MPANENVSFLPVRIMDCYSGASDGTAATFSFWINTFSTADSWGLRPQSSRWQSLAEVSSSVTNSGFVRRNAA